MYMYVKNAKFARKAGTPACYEEMEIVHMLQCTERHIKNRILVV